MKAKKRKDYTKPKLTSKKIKISFFLSQTSVLDQFSFIAEVYAQSGGGGDGGTSYSLGTDVGSVGDNQSSGNDGW